METHGTAIEHLRRFLDAHRELEVEDPLSGNLLLMQLSPWVRYYGFLNIVRLRYEKATADFVAKAELFVATLKNESSRQTGAFSDAHRQHEEALSMLHLEIETFYLFAELLLDYVARTFRFYFWRKNDWSHYHLLTNFPRIVVSKDLNGVPAGFEATMQKLQDTVVEYRHKNITHVPDPRIMQGTAWGLDKQAIIVSTGIATATTKIQQRDTLPLESLFFEIDSYLRDMIALLTANTAKSVILRKTAIVGSPSMPFTPPAST